MLPDQLTDSSARGDRKEFGTHCLTRRVTSRVNSRVTIHVTSRVTSRKLLAKLGGHTVTSRTRRP